MEVPQQSATPSTELSSDQLGLYLQDQRRKVVELLARGRGRVEDLGNRLNNEIQALSETIQRELAVELDSERAKLSASRNELAQQQEELVTAQTETANQLQSWAEELSARDQELTEREGELARQEGELTALASQNRQERQQLETDREEFEAEAEQCKRDQQRFEEQQKRLEREFAELEARKAETREQRKRVSDRLKAERAAQLTELELKRREIDVLRETTRKESERELTSLRAQLQQQETLHAEQTRQMRSELEQARKQAAAKGGKTKSGEEEWQPERQKLESRIAELETAISTQAEELLAAQALLEQAPAPHPGLPAEIEAELAELRGQAAQWQSLRTERDALADRVRAAELQNADSDLHAAEWSALVAERTALQARLEAAEERAAAAEIKLTQQAAVEEDPEHIADLQRRFEMALDDVRGLKRKNAELESQLSAARKNTGEVDVGGGSWESMKKKLLAELESSDGEISKQERLQVEDAIQKTTEIVAIKDREIADLRQLLEEQSNNLGDMALGAAAVANVLDHDELILSERERLKAAQDEWRDKLRAAEVEISLERARLARDRAELEERLQHLPNTPPPPVKVQDNSPPKSDADKKSFGGRWLARLGLKENNG
ncbi:MAG: hypothetical protein SFX18_02100 [Pirellulales bacterium]|nr:hypothetical protein [Pirellulales bacterium]